MDAVGFTHPAEARQILAKTIKELRDLGYEELERRCGTVKHVLFGGRFEIREGGDPPTEIHVVGPSGVAYYLEIVIENPFGPVHVSVSIGEVYRASGEIGDGFELERPERSS